MQYFKLIMDDEDRWTLAIKRYFPNKKPVDIWAYSKGELTTDETIPFSVDVKGKLVDFNPTAFGTIVASTRMAIILKRFAGSDIQRIPASIDNVSGEWEVVNVLSVVDCIDHGLSKIQYYPMDHPDKPGMPRGVIKLVIDPDRAKGHHLFKPKDWLVATIVSSDLREAIERGGITGVGFSPVSECLLD